MIRTLRNRAVIVAAALLSGCGPKTYTIELDPPLEGLASQAPLPLKAGVYYSPEFSSFQYERRLLGDEDKHVVDIGDTSVRLFDRVLGMTFKDVVHLERFSPGSPPTSARVDVVVEPRLDAFHMRMGFEGDSERQGVTYLLRVYDARGNPVDAQIVRGKAPAEKVGAFQHPANADLRDAAEKIPSVLRRMLASYEPSRAVTATPIDTAQLRLQALPAADPFPLAPGLALPLVENSILAFTVTATNNGTQPVLFRSYDFALVLPTGRSIAPAATFAVPQRLERGSSAAMYGGAALLGPLFGLAVGISQGSQQDQLRAKITGMLQDKGFRERVLRPGETAQGTVMFVPAEDVVAFSSAQLQVGVADDAGQRSVFVMLPIDNIAYTPRKKKEAQASKEPLPAAAVSAPAEPVKSAAVPAASAAVSAAASPAGDRMPRQGDTWTYRLTVRDRGTRTVKTRRYDVMVAAVTPSAVFDRVSLEGGFAGDSAHDRGRYLTSVGVPIFSPYLFAFDDLPVGSSLGAVEIKQQNCKTSFLCEAKGHIAGRETITVKAGTFSTVKVVVDHNWRPIVYRGGGQAPMGWTDGRRMTIWYSPAAKRAVKYSSRVTSGSDAPEDSHYDLELESYRVQ